MKAGRVVASMVLVIAIAGCQQYSGEPISSAPRQQTETAVQPTDAEQEQAQRLDLLPPIIPAVGIDRSGRKQAGKASYYARKFDGRKMADGHTFRRSANIAASKTLPLGTTAKVTNVETGKSAVVTVQDRGPHVRGRVLDVSPSVATQIGLKHKGVASVVVKPIAVPKPDGSVKLGAGAAETPAPVVQQAIKTTQRLASGQ